MEILATFNHDINMGLMYVNMRLSLKFYLLNYKIKQCLMKFVHFLKQFLHCCLTQGSLYIIKAFVTPFSPLSV